MKKYILIMLLVILYFSATNACASEREIGINIGLKAGTYSIDRVNSLNIFSLGGTAGFFLPFENRHIEAGLEWDLNLGYFGGDYVSGYPGNRSQIRTIGVYGVVKTIPVNEIYLKGKVGITDETVIERIEDVERKYKEEGLSFGIGIGYEAANNVNIEAEFNTTNSDMKFFGIGLIFIL